MSADTTLLQKVEELSARVATVETENTRLQTENRLLRQKLDQYIRHYFVSGFGATRLSGIEVELGKPSVSDHQLAQAA